MVNIWIIVAGLLIFSAIVGFLISLALPDEVTAIDNSDGHVICGDTEEPCIKTVLYTYCDNCSDCPIRTHIE